MQSSKNILILSGESFELNRQKLGDVLWSMGFDSPRPLIDRLSSIAHSLCAEAKAAIPAYQPSASGMPSGAQRLLPLLGIAGDDMRCLVEVLLFACSQSGYADCSAASIADYPELSRRVQEQGGYHRYAALQPAIVLEEALGLLGSYSWHLVLTKLSGLGAAGTPLSAGAVAQALQADITGFAERFVTAVRVFEELEFVRKLWSELLAGELFTQPEEPPNGGLVRIQRPTGT